MRDAETPAVVLAGYWCRALQALSQRAAHEVNNALNGALVNLEVVKARARPGADAGAVASFATAASEQLEETAALTAALLSLARPTRGVPDVAALLRDAVTLLRAASAHDGVSIELVGLRSCAVGGDESAARLGVVAPLLEVATRAAVAVGTVEAAGSDPAGASTRTLRCTTRSDPRPAIELSPRFDTVLPPALVRVLAEAGVDVSHDSDALVLAFPAPASP